ncbi:hypothetical protein PQX77_011942 [Marasmius sp. AFHP31]|nr:hypothetical protein PQX77_011942 [Marasmius sp. AFHP31]
MALYPLLFVSLLLAQLISAELPDGRLNANFRHPPTLPTVRRVAAAGPPISRNGTELPPYNTVYWFDQLINHQNPSLGTFKQRFWHTYEFYEPGGPIILTTPGENPGTFAYEDLTNATIYGLIAQQEHGSVVVMEHRFFGESHPYPALTGKNLMGIHTVQQAIDDLEYFAKNVKLPMPNGEDLGPEKAPWVLAGGSYPGALVGWTMVNKPGLFWAGYSSSGVVQAIYDFWQYFEPIRQNMPKNCSADVEAAIARIDDIIASGDAGAIRQLKDTFGMGDLEHSEDFVGALRNNIWDWQSLQPGSGTLFYFFCDALEVKDGEVASESGWGAEHAVAAWGNWWITQYRRITCGKESTEECLGTYNPNATYYTDTSVTYNQRSWVWMLCNEFGWSKTGAPAGNPTIVSRLARPSYELRQCQLMFPDVFGSAAPDTEGNVEKINEKYGGWNLQVDRLFLTNGMRDPWKEASISAQGLNKPSTDRQVIMTSEGYHCSDLSTEIGALLPSVGAVQKKALETLKGWLAEWPST